MRWEFSSGLVAATIAIYTIIARAVRKWRASTINTLFIRDMASNHLPHIYTALAIIGEKVGANVPEHPRIKFLDEKDFEG